MKKILLLAAAFALAAPAFAQEGAHEREHWHDSRQMAITLNLTPLLIGALVDGFGMEAGFEFAPARFAAAKINVQYIGFGLRRLGVMYDDDSYGNGVVSMLRVNLDGRWYPQGNFVRGWFVNGGLQFHRIAAPASLFDEDGTWGGNRGLNTFSVLAGVGYKLVFRSSQRAAFVLEPGLDFIWQVASQMPRVPGDFLLGAILGTRGVRFNMLLGAAF